MQSVLPARERGQVSLMSSIKVHANSCVHCHAVFPSLRELCRSASLLPGRSPQLAAHPPSPPTHPHCPSPPAAATACTPAARARRKRALQCVQCGTRVRPAKHGHGCTEAQAVAAAPAHLADAAAGGARHQAAQAQAGVEVELHACRENKDVERCSLSSAGLQGRRGGCGARHAGTCVKQPLAVPRQHRQRSPWLTHDSAGPCTASAVWP